MNCLEILTSALTARAEKIQREWPDAGSLAVRREVAEMQHKQLWVEKAVGGAMADGEPLVAEAELPEHSVALAIGHHRVLIGSLGDTPAPHAIQAELLRHLNQAAIAWTWLGHAGDDLLLILVGPEDSDREEEWQQAMSIIERDERVCRKLVWLPPSAPDPRNESLEALIDRTFLARPWLPTRRSRSDDAPAAGDLDLMARLFARITGGGLGEDEARRWIDILSDPAEQPDLAEKLVAALETDP